MCNLLWLYSLLRFLKSNISSPAASFLSYNFYCVHSQKLKFYILLKTVTLFLIDLSYPKSIELAQLLVYRIISSLGKIILSFRDVN